MLSLLKYGCCLLQVLQYFKSSNNFIRKSLWSMLSRGSNSSSVHNWDLSYYSKFLYLLIVQVFCTLVYWIYFQWIHQKYNNIKEHLIRDDFLKGEKMKYENSIDCIGSISHQSINLQFNKMVIFEAVANCQAMVGWGKSLEGLSSALKCLKTLIFA